MSQEKFARHLGIIMDGNRRWAKARKMPAIEGHRAGFKVLKKLLPVIRDLGVEYVSVYAFSTENWKRSKDEVHALMGLVRWVFKNELETFNKEDIRLRIAGSRKGVPQDIIDLIDNAEAQTVNNKGGTLVICFNYGGKDEIADAVRAYVDDGGDIVSLSSEDIGANLYVPDVPPIDLILRTSGEKRLSNFMLWRSDYAELEFVDTLWPDFTDEQLIQIVTDYAQRNRRFGQ